MENEITISGYIVRDEDGSLALFGKLPERTDYGDQNDWWVHIEGRIELDNNLFPNINWNDEPFETTITLKPKKQ